MCTCVHVCARVCTLPHQREIRDVLSFWEFNALIHLDHHTSSKIKRNRKETIFDNPLAGNVPYMASDKPFGEKKSEQNDGFLWGLCLF